LIYNNLRNEICSLDVLPWQAEEDQNNMAHVARDVQTHFRTWRAVGM